MAIIFEEMVKNRYFGATADGGYLSIIVAWNETGKKLLHVSISHNSGETRCDRPPNESEIMACAEHWFIQHDIEYIGYAGEDAMIWHLWEKKVV